MVSWFTPSTGVRSPGFSRLGPPGGGTPNAPTRLVRTCRRAHVEPSSRSPHRARQIRTQPPHLQLRRRGPPLYRSALSSRGSTPRDQARKRPAHGAKLMFLRPWDCHFGEARINLFHFGNQGVIRWGVSVLHRRQQTAYLIWRNIEIAHRSILGPFGQSARV